MDVEFFKAELLQAYTQISTTTNFATTGPIPDVPNPGLVVHDLGVVGFPLSAREADVLTAKCRRSPVGKGTKTLHDESVRKSWELNPDQFRLTNPRFHDCIDQLLGKVYTDLGMTCGRGNISAKLYKLLIYEEGAFFKSHQDSEKECGMFGTMAISLPSAHEGGDVVLRHDKNRIVFSSAAHSKSPADASFGAWFSNVFHEVERVKEGYRIVLIYNLLQSQNTPRQYAAGADSEARLSSALQSWEQALLQFKPGFPPYLIHKLEHTYSQDALKLISLKGSDAARVQTLERVAGALEFEIFLATYEKIVHKDDDCGDEVFEKEENLVCVTQLDGKSTEYSPILEDYCNLVEPDSEDDDGSDYDESEHEGWTGNEGSPAQYWYRDTVIIMLPPSRKLAFMLSSPGEWQAISQLLPKLSEKADTNEDARQKLYQVCEAAVAKQRLAKTMRRYGLPSFAEPHESCLETVIMTALSQNWLHIYNRCPEDTKLNPTCLEALGRYAGRHGVALVQNDLERLLENNVYKHQWLLLGEITAKSEGRIERKHKVLQFYRRGFDESNPTTTRRTEYELWHNKMIESLLEFARPQVKADMVALAEIAMESTRPNFMSAVRSQQPYLMVYFVNRLHALISELGPKADLESFRNMLMEIWDDFRFTDDVRRIGADMEGTGYNYPPAGYHGGKETCVNGLGVDDLRTVLQVVQTWQPEILPSVVEAMKDAIPVAGSRYVTTHLVEFVKATLEHTIPALIIEANPDIYEVVSDFVKTALVAYIECSITREPQPPSHWRTQAPECRKKTCADCEVIMPFMADPTSQSFELTRLTEIRRKHLDSTYVNRVSYPQYDVQSSYGFWRIDKRHKVHEIEHTRWTGQRRAIRTELRKMAGHNGERLRAYLGDDFNAIMCGMLENLPQPEKPLGSTSASRLNQSNKKRARPVSAEASGIENNIKRSRGTPKDPVVIDDFE